MKYFARWFIIFGMILLWVRCGEDNPPVAEVNLAEEETCSRLKLGHPQTIYPHVEQFLRSLPAEVCVEFENCHIENLNAVRDWLLDFECIHQSVVSDSVILGQKHPLRELAIAYTSDSDITDAILLFELQEKLTYIGIKE